MRADENSEAIASFRRALHSEANGYPPINVELARALSERGRTAEAVALLRAALHNNLESVGFFVTHTVLRDHLARAYEQSGQVDSAIAQYRRVADAWGRGDPPFRRRAEAAALRMARLRSDAPPVTTLNR